MPETLQTTGAKLWSIEDYDELWLSIFEQLSGTGDSNIRKIDTTIKNLNEKFENKLDGCWFETVDGKICLCKKVGEETEKQPLVLGEIDVATTDKAGIVKPDGVSITVDENGVISVDKIEVDNELSSTSENPVQNKIITDELLSKVKIVKVTTLPSEDIKKYPIVYALKDKDNSYTLNEYTDDGWVLYGGTNSEVVILTQEAYDELSEEEKHDGTIRYVETDDDNSESSNIYIPLNEKGIAGGIATLNEDGKVPLEQLPEIKVDTELSATSENPVQNKVVHKKLDEVFQSVSSGKSLVASAITDKGIVTESDATFQTMADNIMLIETGGGELHGASISGTTAESYLVGQSIILSLNGSVISATTIAEDGTFTFLDIQEEGTYKVSSTDGVIQTETSVEINASHIINKTILNVVLVGKYATINVLTEEETLFGKTVNLYKGEELINSYLLSSDGKVSFILTEKGEYTLKSTNGEEETTSDFTVTDDDINNKNSISVELSFVKIVTWADGSWDDISEMLQAHYNRKINIADYWSVGDIRRVSLKSVGTAGVGESHEAQEVELVIIDFKHDDLVSGGKAAVTVQQRDSLSEYGYMNSSDTNVNGWGGCARRTWCNNAYKKVLPTALASLIKTVVKKTSAGNQSSTIKTSNDDVFMVSEVEVFGQTSYSFAGEGEQYEYYKTTANRVKYQGTARATAYNWWERSPYSSNAASFCNVHYMAGGVSTYNGARQKLGLAPAFCI